MPPILHASGGMPVDRVWRSITQPGKRLNLSVGGGAENLFDGLLQLPDILLSDLPHSIEVDPHIIVNKHVAHAANSTPG